jgi:hypothetical protein
MLKRETFPVADIYVPTARRKTLDLKRVDAIAHSMLTVGQQTPILLREECPLWANSGHVALGLITLIFSPADRPFADP